MVIVEEEEDDVVVSVVVIGSSVVVVVVVSDDDVVVVVVGVAAAGVKLIITGEVFGLINKKLPDVPKINPNLGTSSAPSGMIKTDTSIGLKTSGLPTVVKEENFVISYDYEKSQSKNGETDSVSKSYGSISEVDSQAVSENASSGSMRDAAPVVPQEVDVTDITQVDSKDSSISSPTRKRKQPDDKS